MRARPSSTARTANELSRRRALHMVHTALAPQRGGGASSAPPTPHSSCAGRASAAWREPPASVPLSTCMRGTILPPRTAHPIQHHTPELLRPLPSWNRACRSVPGTAGAARSSRGGCTKCRAQTQHHLDSVHAPFMFLLHLCFELRICCACLRIHPKYVCTRWRRRPQHSATTVQA